MRWISFKRSYDFKMFLDVNEITSIYVWLQTVAWNELWLFGSLFYRLSQANYFRNKNVYKRIIQMSVDAFTGEMFINTMYSEFWYKWVRTSFNTFPIKTILFFRNMQIMIWFIQQIGILQENIWKVEKNKLQSE